MSDTFTVALSPPPGIDSDDTSFAAQGRWSDSNNVRPFNGSMQTLGGTLAVYSVGGAEIITELAVVGVGTLKYLLIGSTDKLFAGSGLGVPAEITPSGFAGTANSWSFAPYGNTVICNPAGLGIYQYTLGGGAAVALTNAPAAATSVLVARRQVLAFGTNEELSGTGNGKCIRGSDIENPTVWATSSSNSAFEDILDDESDITAAKVIGDYIAVWTKTSLWMGTFLGNPDQIYQWEKIAGGQGCTGVSAACVDGGIATWFGPDYQIWQWAPGGVPAPVPCPISKEFGDNLFETTLVRLAPIPHFGEVWLFYHDSRGISTRASRYIAFNKQGQWFRGGIARDAVASGGLATQLVQAQAPDTTAAGGFLAAKDGTVYCHEVSEDAGGTPVGWSLKSASQYLNEGRRRTMITRLVPDFGSLGGDVSLSLYMRDRPQSSPVTKGPYTIAANATKVDFRASGMIVEAEFSGSHFARFGKPTFDCVALGER